LFLFGVADDQVNTYLFHLGRGKLGVTAGDDDRRRRVGAFDLSDELTAFARSDGRNRTGIEDAELGWIARSDHPVSGFCQAAGHGFDLAYIEAATDGLETNLHRFLFVSTVHLGEISSAVINPRGVS
jgi:hypothetical protein